MNKDETIQSLVRRLETYFISGTTHPSKYVTVYFSDEMNKIYAYLESQFTGSSRSTSASGTLSGGSSDTDSLGRDKPFFNIVLAARNIWFRATDIDRKDIKVKATKASDTLIVFIATAFIQEWMRRENFGQFLNDWGLNSAGFNESIVKFVEQEGRLIPSIVPWSRMICDPVNFKQNPKIEVLEMTEAELRNHTGYDQTKVTALLDTAKPRETIEKQRKDNKVGYVKLYEVHGEFSQKVYKQALGQDTVPADEKIFFQQMHVIAYVPLAAKGTYADFTLYVGKEKDPYLLTALMPEIDGSIGLRGSVKSLFTAQWMVNHSVKLIKDQLDLASKLIFQTSDGNFVGQNALSSIESGDILIHSPNMPLTQIANNSHDIAPIQNFGTMWQALGNQLVGISEAMLGKAPASGTAWQQTKAVLEENHSLFDIMTQNKGLAVEQMLRTFIIPFIKRQLGNSKEIVATLDSYGISKIDTIYVNQEAIKKMVNKDIEAILKGEKPQQDLQGSTSETQNQLSLQGGQRFFKPSEVSSKTWKDIFKDLEWELQCDITGEDAPDKDDLATLTTVLGTLATNPRVLFDPNAKLIFNKILSIAGGVSALELQEAQPFIPLPTRRVTETIQYVDAPDDIKRQMEAQEGFTPSQMGGSPPRVTVSLKTMPTPPQPSNAPAPPAPTGAGSMPALPTNK